MKISIWRQFSSNHSADFSMIGTFESPEKAAEAAEKIRHILREVAAFWQNIPADERATAWSQWKYDLTPVEQRLSQEYAVEWAQHVELGGLHALDWIPADIDRALTAVTLFDRCVFLENIGDTYVGSVPFDTLLQKWGGAVVGWSSMGGEEFRVVISCAAPDKSAAEQLMNEVVIVREVDHPDYQTRALLIAGRFNVTDQHHEKIRREGQKLIYPLGDFLEWKEDFPAFIDYLRGRGCVEITYTFEQVGYHESE